MTDRQNSYNWHALKMDSIPFLLVDAFTDRPFAGNPAGVCLLKSDMTTGERQRIATEIGVSETAFYDCRDQTLRWFSPKVEIDLCGHATLATVVALVRRRLIDPGQRISFSTRSGLLHCHQNEGLVSMDFPLAPPVVPETPNADLLCHLGLDQSVKFYGKSGKKLLIEVEWAASIRGLQPDFRALSNDDAYGVIVTALAQDGYDTISRYFQPWAGVNEDPVTGSAHCVLARYASERLGRRSLRGYQASSRGGIVGMELMPGNRVLLTGHGVVVVDGTLELG